MLPREEEREGRWFAGCTGGGKGERDTSIGLVGSCAKKKKDEGGVFNLLKLKGGDKGGESYIMKRKEEKKIIQQF